MELLKDVFSKELIFVLFVGFLVSQSSEPISTIIRFMSFCAFFWGMEILKLNKEASKRDDEMLAAIRISAKLQLGTMERIERLERNLLPVSQSIVTRY